MSLITEVRLRSQLPAAAMEEMVGKNPTNEEYAMVLTQDIRVLKPNGQVLCVLRKGAFPQELLDASYPALHSLKGVQTNNRGYASASKRVRLYAGTRTYTKAVSSAIVGSFEAKPPYSFCRQTAWTGMETAKFKSLWPLFQAIGEHFKREVPDRWAAQMRYVAQTKEEWVVPGTPFTTVTVNNSMATGVHTDAGDLAEGFSNLVVLRRGNYTGGLLVFPQYRVAVDMQEGDCLLMDAHEWHGNTKLEGEGFERISIVAYYRTKLKLCGTAQEEAERARNIAMKRTNKEFGLTAVPTAE